MLPPMRKGRSKHKEQFEDPDRKKEFRYNMSSTFYLEKPNILVMFGFLSLASKTVSPAGGDLTWGSSVLE